MKAQHTPGPWEAFTQDSFSGWWAVRQAGGSEVGSCDGGFEKADATLMAASPNLLSALQNLCIVFADICERTGYSPGEYYSYRAAQEAIEKATSEK